MMPDGGIVPQYLALDIEHELGNWADWARIHGSKGQCASIEHHYTPPKHFHPENPRGQVDVHAALDVERAMRQMPRQHQQALIWHYFGRAPSRYICRRLVLQHADWDRFLDDARTMLTNLLLRTGKWRIQSS